MHPWSRDASWVGPPHLQSLRSIPEWAESTPRKPLRQMCVNSPMRLGVSRSVTPIPKQTAPGAYRLGELAASLFWGDQHLSSGVADVAGKRAPPARERMNCAVCLPGRSNRAVLCDSPVLVNNPGMKIVIKSPEQIERMREAGRLAAEVLDMITPHVVAGVTTEHLDQICYRYITEEQGTIPANVGYRGFPKTLCTSVNNVICHGIPSDNKVLKDGDIINIDVTVIKDGWHGDTSRMYLVGQPSVIAKRLVDVTFEAMWHGIRVVRPGATLGDVGHAIQSFVEANRFSVVREYCGHGIGQVYHEDPQVLHYGLPGTGTVLKKGMTFTIEPMINAGARHTRLLPDGWTVVTKDRSLSAQWEHMIAVTDDGFDVLTLSKGCRRP